MPNLAEIVAKNVKFLTHWVKWVKDWVMSKEIIVINHYLLTHTVALPGTCLIFFQSVRNKCAKKLAFFKKTRFRFWKTKKSFFYCLIEPWFHAWNSIFPAFFLYLEGENRFRVRWPSRLLTNQQSQPFLLPFSIFFFRSIFGMTWPTNYFQARAKQEVEKSWFCHFLPREENEYKYFFLARERSSSINIKEGS